MGGNNIGIVQGTPILFASLPKSVTWIMCKCTGTVLKMVQVVVSVSGGLAYANATAAGAFASTCTSAALTEAAVYLAWTARSGIDVATCDSCDGFGIRSLAYTKTGSFNG